MIHKYYLNGFYIVMDINSGAVYSVDKLSYDMIDYIDLPMSECCTDKIYNFFNSYSKQEIDEAYNELFELYNEGVLFSNDEYEKLSEEINVPAPIKAVCLHMSHDCNLRCKYCFAGEGNYGHKKKLMSFQVAKEAIDFVIEKSENRRNIELDFFGGEPLLNFDVVKKTVEYARSIEKQHNKNFRFTITTNGMLLNDEITDYINKEMSNVVLSLDGRKEINDVNRHKIDGSGTYDIIMPKYIDLVKKRDNKNYYVRGTFTSDNLDFSNDVKSIVEKGFDQLSIEPVVSPETAPYALKKEHLDTIYKEYEQLAKYIIDQSEQGKSFNFFHFMIDLSQGPCVIKRLKGCGSGNEYVAITPDGEIYPCHQFVGTDSYLMGNVFDKKIDDKIKTQFAGTSVYTKEKCKDCWAKFYCSGGCNANNYIYNGDIHIPHEMSCELEKKRVECAIMIKIALDK